MRRALLLSLLLITAACGRSGAPARGVPDAARLPQAAPDSLVGPWMVRNAGRPRSQLVTLRAVLRSRVDTLTREDTVASETLLEWSTVPDASPARVVGMVRRFAVGAGGDSAWRTLADPPMPVSFTAVQANDAAAPTFLVPADTACSARAAIVQPMRETWLQAPRRLAPGTTWQDSTTYPLCRDGILLRAEQVRRYVVDGAVVQNGQLAVRVRRTTRTALSGRGVQFGDTITVRGDGEGSALLAVSLDGAAIIAGSGTSELRLTLQGRRRTQQLVQLGALEIREP